MTNEPEDEYDYEAALDYEVILDDLASDRDDFSRSNDEGWYYSDED